MLEKIYWILEMYAIIICLHGYYNKKFKFNICNVVYISLEILIMQLIYSEIVSKNVYFLVYLLFYIYSCIEFKDTYKLTILKCALSILTTGLIQMLLFVPLQFLSVIISDDDIIVLLVNLILFILAFLLYKDRRISKLADFCQKKEWLLKMCIAACILFLGYCMYMIKDSEKIAVDIYLVIAVFLVVVSYMLIRWKGAASEAATKDRQLKSDNIYTDALNELIQTTRKRQHDFNNHINAIYGMHLSIDNYDELVKNQKEYCKNVEYENRFTRLLNGARQPVIAGFLFQIFTKIEENNIEIDYDVAVSEKESPIAVYDLIEIIGILLDNAKESLLASDLERKIKFELAVESDILVLSVKNVSRHMDHGEIQKFFQEGYSTKGENRGLGLGKVREYQKKYHYDILCKMCNLEDKDWFTISIIKGITIRTGLTY